MNTVKIKIFSVQKDDVVLDDDVIELVTDGTIEKIDDTFIANYDESDLAEHENSKTRLKIWRNKMTMTKIGVFSSKMEFEVGKKYSNIYATPYGCFQLDFITTNYVYCLNNDGIGYLALEYKMMLAESKLTYNKLRIEIN